MATIGRFSSILFLVVLASCTNSLPSVVGERRLKAIEMDYQKVIHSEDRYDPGYSHALMNYFKAADAGVDQEGDPSGWTNSYHSFARTVNEVPMSPETHKKLCVYLMSKYGVISSFVKLPQTRSKCIHYHLSFEDAYAFDLDEVRKIIPSKNLHLTVLLRSLIESPELYQ